MVVTLEVSQLEMSWSNRKQSSNMSDMSVTRDTSQAPMSSLKSLKSIPEKRWFMSVTLLTSHVPISPYTALAAAEVLALQIAAFPQACLRGDRSSALAQGELSEADALAQEFGFGLKTLHSGETLAGAARFSAGSGRHGTFADETSK